LKMAEAGMIPVFYNSDVEVCKQVISACYKGGVRLFEFTNRGAYAHLVFEQINKWAASEYPDLIIGTGSVVDAPTAILYVQLDSNFIVSPILNEEMAYALNRRKVLWTPGCGSVSEISYAEELGADIIKIFPGSSVGGPDFIKSVKGPCPWTSLMPTGGVEPTIENLKSWYDAGAVCVGMGSNLITKDIIAKKDWDGLSEKIAATLKIAQTLRKK